MSLPVIDSHLMGSSGLYGASIGAPGIPLMMGVQISEQNGVHIMKKPPIPPIHVVKGSANPIVQADKTRKRRRIYPQLQADMQMAAMMPQSLNNMSMPLPHLAGNTMLPPIPMVSQMGMSMGPQINRSTIMPHMLPHDAMNMAGMSQGMGPGPQMPHMNFNPSDGAMGLALMGGSQMGNFPPGPPMMINQQHFMQNLLQDDHHGGQFNPGTYNQNANQFHPHPNSQMAGVIRQIVHQHPDQYHQHHNNYNNYEHHNQNNFEPQYPPPTQKSKLSHSSSKSNIQVNEEQRPIIINTPPQPAPVIFVQQPPPMAMPMAQPVAQNSTGGLIDKIGLVTGMVMAQKNSNRSKQIQAMQLAQLNQIKSQHDMNKSMMHDIQMQRTFLQQDRTRLMQSQYMDPNMIRTQVRDSRMLPANILQTTIVPGGNRMTGMNLDLSRISVGTTEEDIRIVVFPKCKPQIFSHKQML